MSWSEFYSRFAGDVSPFEVLCRIRNRIHKGSFHRACSLSLQPSIDDEEERNTLLPHYWSYHHLDSLSCYNTATQFQKIPITSLVWSFFLIQSISEGSVLEFEPTKRKAPKKPKNRRNRLCYSNEAKPITNPDWIRPCMSCSDCRLGRYRTHLLMPWPDWKAMIIDVYSIMSSWNSLFAFKLLRELYEVRPPERKPPKKLKNRRNRLCQSNEVAMITRPDVQRTCNAIGACNELSGFGATLEDFEIVETIRGNRVVSVTYNITAKGSAQVVVGDKARIVNNYCTSNKQDETLEGGELTTFLKVYYRTGLRALLLPFPWMEGDEFRIDIIYTPVKMVEIYANRVVTLEGIFVKAATDHRNIRRILIEGEPGIGKSAICKKIAYDWSMDKTPQLFPTFEVVLSLKCRDFHTGIDLWDAIEMQTFSDDLKEKRDEIFKYIKSNQNKVLLILDGYDEIPDKSTDSMKQSTKRLIHGQLLPHCYIIMTSRPGKASEIRNYFDRKLKIKGFELENSFKFIQRSFFSLSSASPETVKASVSSIMASEAFRKDLVRNPLYASILCLVYQEKKDDKSLTLGTLHEEIIFSLIKRYYSEKLDKEIEDDDLMREFHNSIYLLGKKALSLIKENHHGIDEKELAVVLAGSQPSHHFIDIGFLDNRKLRNKIRPESYYIFPHDSFKQYSAMYYVKMSFSSFKMSFSSFKMSFSSLDGREIVSILTFRNFGSFLRFINLLFPRLFKIETRVLTLKCCTWLKLLIRLIRCIFYCFLYSLYIAIKITIRFISLMKRSA